MWQLERIRGEGRGSPRVQEEGVGKSCDPGRSVSVPMSSSNFVLLGIRG